LEKGLEIAKILEIEKPDRIFLLRVPWEIAYERKSKEARTSDRHEKDKSLFEKTAAGYEKVLKMQIFAPWTTIDATKTPEEEAQEIFEIIKKDINK